jgi:hypothetical protein
MPMDMPKPTEEHTWLQRLAGEWTYAGEMKMGEEEHKSTGTETIRTFGGFWTVGEMLGKMPGSDIQSKSVISLGYDPDKKKYVGTFISDMMSFMWVYEGTRKGDVLTLDCEGPSFKGDGQMVQYQDIIEIKSDSEYVMSSQTRGEDGKWKKFMSMTFTRAT